MLIDVRANLIVLIKVHEYLSQQIQGKYTNTSKFV